MSPDNNNTNESDIAYKERIRKKGKRYTTVLHVSSIGFPSAKLIWDIYNEQIGKDACLQIDC